MPSLPTRFLESVADGHQSCTPEDAVRMAKELLILRARADVTVDSMAECLYDIQERLRACNVLLHRRDR